MIIIIDNPISTYGLIYLSNVFKFLLNVQHITLHAISSSIAVSPPALSIFFRSLRKLNKLEVLNYRCIKLHIILF